MPDLKTSIIILTLAVSLLFSLFDGLVINWRATTDPTRSARISRQWHAVGAIIHFLILVMLSLAGGWLWCLIGFFTVWLVHNIIIALLMGQKWYYVGKTAWFDKLIRKLLPFIKFDK